MKNQKPFTIIFAALLFGAATAIYNIAIYAQDSNAPPPQVMTDPNSNPGPAAPGTEPQSQTNSVANQVALPAATQADQINEFIMLEKITAAFEELKSKNIYSIKDIKLADYLRSSSNIADYISNKKYLTAKKNIIKTLDKSAKLNLTSKLDSVDIMLLDKSKLLVVVPYLVAAAKTDALFFTYDAKDIKLTATPFEPEDGADYKSYSFTNNNTFSVPDSGILQVITKARAAGDCGTVNIYKFINDFFKIINQREVECSK